MAMRCCDLSHSPIVAVRDHQVVTRHPPIGGCWPVESNGLIRKVTWPRERNTTWSFGMTTEWHPSPMVARTQNIAREVRCTHLEPKRRDCPTRSLVPCDGIGKGDDYIPGCAISRGSSRPA